MGRTPCCAKVGLKRGAWTAHEDKILTDYIQVHGEGRWKQVPINAGLMRCGKSCRLRWLNYLRPDIKRGNISEDEEELIVRLHKLLGNRWSLIAGRIPGRTDNEIKNYWNTNLSKKAASSSVAPPVVANPDRSKPKNTSARIVGPNSSSSRVMLQPPSPTDIVVSDEHQVKGRSLFNSNNDDLTAEGSLTAELLDNNVDDLDLEDFCLSDFLDNDQFEPQLYSLFVDSYHKNWDL